MDLYEAFNSGGPLPLCNLTRTPPFQGAGSDELMQHFHMSGRRLDANDIGARFMRADGTPSSP
eukprot:6588492-Alexandrium_andersonii.AAC.1